jgi:hypothetical protein
LRREGAEEEATEEEEEEEEEGGRDGAFLNSVRQSMAAVWRVKKKER